jgi:hypothetical protein
MKHQLKLSLEEVIKLAIERLIEQGKLSSVATHVDWHFNTWKISDGYVVISQEDQE